MSTHVPESESEQSNQIDQGSQLDQASQPDQANQPDEGSQPDEASPSEHTDQSPRRGGRTREREHGTDAAVSEEETILLKVFRYDPEVADKEKPRFDDFHVPFKQGMTVLDALIYARDHYDSSLTFRHSCRQAICGSDALFINGSQRLGCKTQISDLDTPVRIEPLPHQSVVKDLVVDMEHFYDQMDAVEPYFQNEDLPSGLEEQHQTRENREKIKMSTRCIWCGACMSSCNIASGGNYLGPAAINKAYRFAMDDREGEELTQERLETIEAEDGVWRCQTQFSCTNVCPKDIPLTEHIQELKREAVKNNLKFW